MVRCGGVGFLPNPLASSACVLIGSNGLKYTGNVYTYGGQRITWLQFPSWKHSPTQLCSHTPWNESTYSLACSSHSSPDFWSSHVPTCVYSKGTPHAEPYTHSCLSVDQVCRWPFTSIKWLCMFSIISHVQLCCVCTSACPHTKRVVWWNIWLWSPITRKC